jgi:predicted RNase H-like nuclease (RuvC/YqgF family)
VNETKELEIAENLLRSTGLNHAAFTRECLNKEQADSTDKAKTREAYDRVLEFINSTYGENVYQDKHSLRLKETDLEDLKKRLDTLEAENAELRSLVMENKDQVPKVELRTCRYHKTLAPQGQIFNNSELDGLDAGWADHPDKCK